MTDRVQQMLDVVKNDFEVAIRKPRGRRIRTILKAKMRADVDTAARDGILKNPLRATGKKQAVDAVSSRTRGVEATYSGPSQPDLWRSPDILATSTTVPARGGLKINPADAAMAAFQSAKLAPKLTPRRRASKYDDRAEPGRVTGRKGQLEKESAPRRPRRGTTVSKGGGEKFSPGLSEIEDIRDVIPPKKRGSWLRALRRS